MENKKKIYGKGYVVVRQVIHNDILIKADSREEAIRKTEQGLMNTDVVDGQVTQVKIEYPEDMMLILSDTGWKHKRTKD